MRVIITTILLAIGFFSSAQNWEPLEVNPSKEGLELNPLKGLAPLFDVQNEFPHSIRGFIVGLDSLMLGIDDFNWRLLDSFLDERSLDGRFGYMQVNVDMGFNRSDLPAFLSNVDRIYYDGTDPEDETGVPSMIVDYNHPEMMAAMLNFIERFGEKYNDNPRVFLVHYGLYGIFGEWDLGFGERFVPDGEEWALTEANQRLITNAYANAFPDKNLLARFPENVPEPQSVGYSDGLYFGASISDDPQFQWFFHPKLINNNADENWKTYPIGGEIDPAVQPTVWENFPNTVVGQPGQPQETEAVFNLTRPTFLFHNSIFKDITESSNPTMWANALKATRRTGYTFHVNEYRLTAAGGQPTIEVNVQNTGLAPMYADWQVEYGYLGGNGEVISLGTSDSWNLKSIQPDVAANYRAYASDVSIPDGTHTFMLRIINPLEAISSLAAPVRFDNLTQDEDETGWLTLGDATITDGNIGEPVVAVTDMTLTPATATMGLFDELQLVAEVLPANATNPAVTWSSNRPATAAVDQNGRVTTNALGGDVVITATTQDGAIVRTANISIESFWVIPGVVEAEGFTDVFMAQVGPTPADEDGGSVLGFINDDTWMEYVLDVAEEGSFVADFRASSPAGVGEIEVLDAGGALITSITFAPGTSSYDTYATYTSEAFTLPAGRFTIRLDVVASAFNLNWVEFRSANVLPIELTSFEARSGEKAIALEWSTSSETENAGFQLERSAGGNDFTRIAWVDGAGTTNEQTAYTYSDADIAANVDYFYRLAQVDVDGTTTYSATVTARLTSSFTDYSRMLKVFPNPTQNEISISWGRSLSDAPIKGMSLLNMLGENVLPEVTNFRLVDLTSLPAGIYILVVDVAGKRITKRVVKK